MPCSGPSVLETILATRRRLGRTTTIGISGIDCTGKSTLARVLARDLRAAGEDAVGIGGDDFNRPVVEPGAVVLLEGVFLFTPAVVPFLDLKIWLDIGFEDASGARSSATPTRWAGRTVCASGTRRDTSPGSASISDANDLTKPPISCSPFSRSDWPSASSRCAS